MYEINSSEKNDIQKLLTNSDNIPEILSSFYPDSTEENKTHLTLGGDAASVNLTKPPFIHLWQYLKKNIKNLYLYSCVQLIMVPQIKALLKN